MKKVFIIESVEVVYDVHDEKMGFGVLLHFKDEKTPFHTFEELLRNEFDVVRHVPIHDFDLLVGAEKVMQLNKRQEELAEQFVNLKGLMDISLLVGTLSTEQYDRLSEELTMTTIEAMQRCAD